MNAFLEVLSNEINKIKKTLTQTGSDYTATVTRVDGNTAYVQMAGSEISDTPVSMTINANVGDKVRVRVSNGRAWITGNDTLPPSNESKEVSVKMQKDMSDREKDIVIDFGKMSFLGNTLVVDSDNFKLDEDGNATFGGTLEAAGGSFTGELSFDWTRGTNRQLLKIANQVGAPFSIQEYDGNGVQTYSSVFQAPYIELRKHKQTIGEDVLIKPEAVTVSQNLGASALEYDGVHTSSDIRLKEDITAIDPETAKHLLPVKFRFKGDDKIHYGFIAQDVQKVIPDVVDESTDGYLTLTYHELIAPLYALVQEQEDRISRLEARIEQLEKGDQE